MSSFWIGFTFVICPNCGKTNIIMIEFLNVEKRARLFTKDRYSISKSNGIFLFIYYFTPLHFYKITRFINIWINFNFPIFIDFPQIEWVKKHEFKLRKYLASFGGIFFKNE